MQHCGVQDGRQEAGQGAGHCGTGSGSGITIGGTGDGAMRGGGGGCICTEGIWGAPQHWDEHLG